MSFVKGKDKSTWSCHNVMQSVGDPNIIHTVDSPSSQYYTYTADTPSSQYYIYIPSYSLHIAHIAS